MYRELILGLADQYDVVVLTEGVPSGFEAAHSTVKKIAGIDLCRHKNIEVYGWDSMEFHTEYPVIQQRLKSLFQQSLEHSLKRMQLEEALPSAPLEQQSEIQKEIYKRGLIIQILDLQEENEHEAWITKTFPHRTECMINTLLAVENRSNFI